MRIKLTATDARFPRRLIYPGGPLSFEALGSMADRLDAISAPVAIVGTRRPSSEAWQFAHWLAATLARAGATIISGGAYGIDAAAHEGALSVGAQTLAILPTSVDKLSPAGNAGLFKRIARSGALVGFLADTNQPRFEERNAHIAALAEDVIVVAAPFRSGARNTAGFARRMNRRVWVVPGSPWDPTMAGCALELRLGAFPLLSPGPVLRALGLAATGRPAQPPSDVHIACKQPWRDAPLDPNPAPPAVGTRRLGVTGGDRAASFATSLPTRARIDPDAAGPDERLLLQSLREGPATIDELVLRTGLPVALVRVLLLTWTVEGVVREGPSGLFRLISG